MVTALSVARRLVPAPTMADMKFAHRGFPVTAGPVSRRFEGVSRAVLEGFEYGADIADTGELVRRLEWIDPLYQSLAYEGAVAALIMRDVLAFGRTYRAEEFVAGPAEPHSLMAYVGFGLVMSRLPRPLWRRALPRFDSNPLVAQLSWLAVDGFGFDRAYFDPRTWIDGTRRPAAVDWEGYPAYFPRAFDQGIGRALMFVHGGDSTAAGAAVARFAPDRHADLWSGIGAALGYIGGQPAGELRAALHTAGAHAPEIAVGAVMGIKARHYAGFVPESAELAAEVLCGTTVEIVAELADAAALNPPTESPVPDYEVWRQRVRSEFADLAVGSV